jgi:lipopolysaccharide export system permease protein
MLVRRVSNYLSRESVPWYLIFSVLLLVLLLIDYFGTLLGFFLRNNSPIGAIFQNVSDRIPFFLSYIIAPGLALAIPVGLGRLGKDSELKALYALGVKPSRMLGVFVVFGLCMSALQFYSTNVWQPAAEERFKVSFAKLFGSEPSNTQELKSFRSLDGSTLFHAGTISPRLEDAKATPKPENKKIADLYGVSVITTEGTYTASRGVWDANTKTWQLFTVYHTKVDGSVNGAPETRKEFPFEAALETDAKLPEYLSLPDLIERASNTALSQQDQFEANYRLQRRFADPLAPLFMALLSAVVGLAIASRALGFLVSIVVIASYWALWITSQQLAASQAVPFWFAAWLPTFCFAAMVLVAYRRLS